jgi:hypothetical protein
VTNAGKIITLLIFGAILLMGVTHAAGASALFMSGGNVLDNTLGVEAGLSSTAGSTGTVNAQGVTIT